MAALAALARALAGPLSIALPAEPIIGKPPAWLQAPGWARYAAPEPTWAAMPLALAQFAAAVLLPWGMGGAPEAT